MEVPWRGDNFSGRLWKNQKKLAVSLNDILLIGLQQGTCDICGEYHEKIYPIEKCVHVLLHANCRCTIIPAVDEKMVEEMENAEVEDMKLMDTTDKWAEEARKKLLKSEKSVASRSKEITEIYGPDGKYIMTKRGDSNSVQFSARDYFKLKDAVVTHNHPSGGTFSVQDIKFLKRTLVSELRVSTEE